MLDNTRPTRLGLRYLLSGTALRGCGPALLPATVPLPRRRRGRPSGAGRERDPDQPGRNIREGIGDPRRARQRARRRSARRVRLLNGMDVVGAIRASPAGSGSRARDLGDRLEVRRRRPPGRLLRPLLRHGDRGVPRRGTPRRVFNRAPAAKQPTWGRGPPRWRCLTLTRSPGVWSIAAVVGGVLGLLEGLILSLPLATLM